MCCSLSPTAKCLIKQVSKHVCELQTRKAGDKSARDRERQRNRERESEIKKRLKINYKLSSKEVL